jgi:hypothetical protein
MPKTPAPEAAPEVAPVPIPSKGGSYVYDPATGELVREGGTEPNPELNPPTPPQEA